MTAAPIEGSAEPVMLGPSPGVVTETWQSIEEKSVELADLIQADILETGRTFDKILIIGRGGYGPGNIVVRRLGMKAHDVVHAAFTSYDTADRERSHDFYIGQMPEAGEIAGNAVLVVDEVCESGESLAFLSDTLVRLGAKEIKTAVLHYKPELTKTGFVPDWFVMTTSEWVAYVWEKHDEAGEAFREKLIKLGIIPVKAMNSSE